MSDSGRRGAFITVEGGDGAGKTTQMDFIEGWLRDHDITVMRTREPGGTAVGERLREILLHGTDLPLSADTELLLVFAARRQHLDERILPSLAAGTWVLCDRFTDATYAYQGAGRGIPAERIARLEEWVQEGFDPDLTVLLDVGVEEAIRRSDDRGESSDRYEREGLSFKEAVRQCYLERARRDPDRFRVVDAGGSLESVQDSLDEILTTFSKQWGDQSR